MYCDAQVSVWYLVCNECYINCVVLLCLMCLFIEFVMGYIIGGSYLMCIITKMKIPDLSHIPLYLKTFILSQSGDLRYQMLQVIQP